MTVKLILTLLIIGIVVAGLIAIANSAEKTRREAYERNYQNNLENQNSRLVDIKNNSKNYVEAYKQQYGNWPFKKL